MTNLGGPRVFRWGAQQQSPGGQAKPNWKLIQGNLSHLQRWSPPSNPTGSSTGGRGHWTLIQGNLAHAIRWTSPAVSRIHSGVFDVAGAVHVTFTPTPIQGIRVAGEIRATFVTGGTVTVGGAFEHTGEVVAVFTIPPVVGFQVAGEITAKVLTRAGQEAECIAGSGVPSSPNSTPANAVY